MDKRWRPTSECDESGGFNRLVGDFVFKVGLRSSVPSFIAGAPGLKSDGKKYKLNSNSCPALTDQGGGKRPEGVTS
jgi:hypothetical protein